MRLKAFFLLISLILVGRVHAQVSSDEWIKAYFNMPSISDSIQVNDNWDLLGTLVELIDSATASVDLNIYDLEHPRIAEALVRAKERGLRVRLITDSHNRDDSKELDPIIWDMLGEAGIYSMDDDGDIYRSSTEIIEYDLVNDGADMHNKFAILDRLSESSSDDIVWTGSTNLTYTGAYNTNNVLVIKDAEVAKVYEEEFNQMWGSEDEEPNPERARFHKDKEDVSQHEFEVNGTRIEIYFAPINRDRSKPSISDRLVRLIEEEAQSDIKFQAFSITPNIPLSLAMWEATGTGDISLFGVIDPSFYARYRNAGDIWGSEEAQMENRMILPAQETRKLHHKILLIDAENPDSDDEGVVVTGSYNFSNNAEVNNDENLIIIFSDEIAAQYNADFKGAFERAQGNMEAPAPPVDPDKWYDVYSIRDGRQFEIEILPGFGYPVQLLGVDVPSIYAGPDSSDYFAGASAGYLKNILEGRKVRIKGPDGNSPISRYGSFKAYVQVQMDGRTVSLNQLMLKNGYGIFSNYYAQHPDSIFSFKEIQQTADNGSVGIWNRASKIGTKVARTTEATRGEATEVVYPININTADQATLQLLPGIGETYAKRIIEYREQNGGFKKVEELLLIRGIGDTRFARLRPIVTL